MHRLIWALFTAATLNLSAASTPVIYCTDLFHPHDDPDDHFDLATLFALPELEVKAILLDQGDKQLLRPGSIPLRQILHLTGRQVPFAIGLGQKLASPADDGRNQPAQFQAAIDLLLHTLSASPSPVTIFTAGSVRDVCAAWNREPALLKQKVGRLYLNIGNANQGQSEYNVDLDPHAYAGLLRSGLPIYLCLCLPMQNEGTNSTYSTWWRFRQSTVLESAPAVLQRYFLYALRKCQPAELDPLQALATDMTSWHRQIWELDRNMWCTAPLLHAAGWHVGKVGGAWAAFPPGVSAVQPESVFTFVPARVEVDDAGKTTLRPNAAASNVQLFQVVSPGNYGQAMRDCLRQLCQQFPVSASTRTNVAPSSAFAPRPAPEEIQITKQWTSEHLRTESRVSPFSFRVGEELSGDLLAKWNKKMDHRNLDADRLQHRLSFTDPRTGLEVRCEAVEYLDFPVVEWTLYFKHNGSNSTPIIDNVNALDLKVPSQAADRIVLRHWRGDSNSPESYAPLEEVLPPGAAKRFAPVGGRPSNGAFPYYNLQLPDGGLILAVGWPGQWSAAFAREAEGGLRILAGQELTHFALKPGEQVRTPLIACLLWQGNDPVRAQNLWRRWMLAHNLPRPAGKPVAPMFAFCSGGFFEGLKVSETSEKQFIDALFREGIKMDYWWMDAGWYPCNSWPQVGTWEPDPQRFPGGLKAVSDYVHACDLKLIVWFEPERVEAGTWLATHHPEWLLGGKLLNLGNPEANQWLTEHIDRLIREQGIDLYRQDFNMDPLEYWRKHDAPDRQGITENLHVQGYLAFWDELRQRHPNLLIDSCASGGRRNDLETLRRAVPLLRSDYQSFAGDPAFAAGNQGHTYGLSSWIPYYGQGVYYNPNQYVYAVRSHFCPAFGMAVDVRKSGLDWPLYRRLANEWRQVADLMLGDYYPLTPYSLAETDWIAWQFHASAKHAGFVQAFRRSKNQHAAMILPLHGLNRGATYTVVDFDLKVPGKMSGKDLMEQGLPVEITTKPGAAIITYTEIQ